MGKVLDRPATKLPPLRDGERMRREEFHRRYEAMGPLARAELIEGRVYVYRYGDGRMASAVSADRHGVPTILSTVWLGLYVGRTPGLYVSADTTVFVDDVNEPQPDVLLGIPESVGGQTRLTPRGDKLYVGSTPELVVEVAASTAKVDTGPKRRAYERNGVLEYVVALPDRSPPQVRWRTRPDGDPAGPLVPLDLDDGLFKSRVFPGLWLDPNDLIVRDPIKAGHHIARLIATLELGCATPEHAAFARRVTPAGGG